MTSDGVVPNSRPRIGLREPAKRITLVRKVPTHTHTPGNRFSHFRLRTDKPVRISVDDTSSLSQLFSGSFSNTLMLSSLISLITNYSESSIQSCAVPFGKHSMPFVGKKNTTHPASRPICIYLVAGKAPILHSQ